MCNLEKTIENSFCFGLYKDSGFQIGYARVITDYTTVAHIADVFISEPFRGLGLSKLLMSEIMNNSFIKNMRKVFLFTQDAQKLYQKFGFSHSEFPNQYMELKKDVTGTGV